ncbi:hypothetical protein VIGAN_10097700, partial [Vigna angularis var. angularis]
FGFRPSFKIRYNLVLIDFFFSVSHLFSPSLSSFHLSPNFIFNNQLSFLHNSSLSQPPHISQRSVSLFLL